MFAMTDSEDPGLPITSRCLQLVMFIKCIICIILVYQYLPNHSHSQIIVTQLVSASTRRVLTSLRYCCTSDGEREKPKPDLISSVVQCPKPLQNMLKTCPSHWQS